MLFYILNMYIMKKIKMYKASKYESWSTNTSVQETTIFSITQIAF